jgi:hypothetical protein
MPPQAWLVCSCRSCTTLIFDTLLTGMPAYHLSMPLHAASELSIWPLLDEKIVCATSVWFEIVPAYLAHGLLLHTRFPQEHLLFYQWAHSNVQIQSIQ